MKVELNQVTFLSSWIELENFGTGHSLLHQIRMAFCTCVHVCGYGCGCSFGMGPFVCNGSLGKQVLCIATAHFVVVGLG